MQIRNGQLTLSDLVIQLKHALDIWLVALLHIGADIAIVGAEQRKGLLTDFDLFVLETIRNGGLHRLDGFPCELISGPSPGR